MKMVDTKKGSSRSDGIGGVKVNRTGRRTYSDAFKSGVVKQCLAPGVSVAAIALSHGINANLVRRWIVREQRRTNVARVMPGPVMLPVTVEATADESPTTTTAKTTHNERAPIEIEFCGARIYLHDGVDAKMLRRVLDVLAQR